MVMVAALVQKSIVPPRDPPAARLIDVKFLLAREACCVRIGVGVGVGRDLPSGRVLASSYVVEGAWTALLPSCRLYRLGQRVLARDGCATMPWLSNRFALQALSHANLHAARAWQARRAGHGTSGTDHDGRPLGSRCIYGQARFEMRVRGRVQQLRRVLLVARWPVCGGHQAELRGEQSR